MNKDFLIILFSVLAGYTLLPIPSVLDRWFKHSYLFKLIVLVVLGLLTTKNSTFIEIVLYSIFILALFHLLRTY